MSGNAAQAGVLSDREYGILWAIGHGIAVIAAGGCLIFLEALIPTGHEGGWLARVYVGFLLAVAGSANALILLSMLIWTGRGAAGKLIHVFILLTPLVPMLWIVSRDA